MNARIVAALLSTAFIAGCAGGLPGGAHGPSNTNPLPPAPPKAQRVTFRLKVPPARLRVRGRKRWSKRHHRYVSPATLAVGISYAGANATFSWTQLQTPNIALDLADCAPANGCTQTTVSGGTQYTLTAPVPQGTYAFAVATWAAVPTGGSFASTSDLLSEAYVPSQTIAAGSSPTLSLSLDGIPAAVSFVPAAGQSHVAPDSNGGTNPGYAVIGNAPVNFYAYATDAAGYVITGDGAPTIQVAAYAGSTATNPARFIVATPPPTSPNRWSLTATDTPVSGSPTYDTIAVTASPPTPIGGQSVAPATSTTYLYLIPELWISADTGASSAGMLGYALNGPSFAAASNPLDSTSLSYDYNGAVAADSAGNLWTEMTPGGEGNATLLQLTAASGSTPPVLPSVPNEIAPPQTGTYPPTIDAVTVDANSVLWFVDPCNNLLDGYPLAGLSGTVTNPTYSSSGGETALLNPQGVAVAPNTPAVNSALRGSILVADTNGISVFTYTNGSGSSLTDKYPAVDNTFPNLSGASAVAVDDEGNVWAYSPSNGYLYVYAKNIGPNGPEGIETTLLASTSVSAEGNVRQIAPQPGFTSSSGSSTVWLSDDYGPAAAYTYSNGSITAGPTIYTPGEEVAGVYVTP